MLVLDEAEQTRNGESRLSDETKAMQRGGKRMKMKHLGEKVR
jgi:hypothetical protein